MHAELFYSGHALINFMLVNALQILILPPVYMCTTNSSQPALKLAVSQNIKPAYMYVAI